MHRKTIYEAPNVSQKRIACQNSVNSGYSLKMRTIAMRVSQSVSVYGLVGSVSVASEGIVVEAKPSIALK